MTNIPQFLIYDELPLWSAPFGLTLLDTIQLKKGIIILDIGSGAGFPMLEIAERAGKSASVFGIDPSEESFRLISEKIRLNGISNALIKQGIAEQLPFDDHFFDLIVSNNGLNNVQDEKKVLSECYRVLAKHGQAVFTMNLPYTMIEFYDIFEQTLLERRMHAEVIKLKAHIHAKRKSVEYWKESFDAAGFSIRTINVDGFKMKFTDGSAFMEHYFIRTAFRKSWEEITDLPEIFLEIEQTLNEKASNGALAMSVPFVCFDCYKES